MDLVVQDGFEPTELDWWQVAALWTCCCGVVAIAWAIWGNNPLSLGAVDHQRQEFGATVCIPGYTNLGNHGRSVKRAGEIDITHFLLHKLSRLGTSGQDSSHTKEKNSVSQVATGPQNGGQINHPARHGEERPASVVGGGQTKREVGGERERSEPSRASEAD